MTSNDAPALVQANGLGPSRVGSSSGANAPQTSPIAGNKSGNSMIDLNDGDGDGDDVIGGSQLKSEHRQKMTPATRSPASVSPASLSGGRQPDSANGSAEPRMQLLTPQAASNAFDQQRTIVTPGAPSSNANNNNHHHHHLSHVPSRNGNESGDCSPPNDDDNNNNNTSTSSLSRYRPQKYCAVCGDKAIACNFNAVTCESCKAFFRRNAFKEQRLKCLFDSRCIIDKVTRRFCSKCRLLKCFAIGMKREWILTDEQKQVKRVKILQNKQSKHQQQQHQHQVPTSSIAECLDTTNHRPRLSSGTAEAQQQQLRHVPTPVVQNLSELDDECRALLKRRRSSSSGDDAIGQQPPPQQRTEKRDASTSCSDLEFELAATVPGRHCCTLAHQCQYCSLRLQQLDSLASNQGQVDGRYPANYHQNQHQFHHHQTAVTSAARLPHALDYQRQQQQHHHAHFQQQTPPHQSHFRYNQAVANYVATGGGGGGSQDATSNATYQQHQMAAALKSVAYASSASASSAAAAAANGGNSTPTSSMIGANQPARGGAPTAAECCCLPFGEMFHKQRWNRSPVSLAPPVISHFADHNHFSTGFPCPAANHIATAAAAATAATPHLHTMEPSAAARGANTPTGTATATNHDNDHQQQQQQAGDTLSASNSWNPFVKALDAQRMVLETAADSPSDEGGLAGSKVSVDDKRFSEVDEDSGDEQKHEQQQQPPLSGGGGGGGGDSQPPTTDGTNMSHDVEAIDATLNGADAGGGPRQTMPDGSPLDKSKYIVCNGVVYAQPAIAETEMRARVEGIDFTETEKVLVYEMIEAIKYMFEPTTIDRSFDDHSLNDFVYFCDTALRRLIKTVKRIRAFRILNMDDQIMLLKTACFKILLLRSCLRYIDDIEGWRDRYGRIMPLSLLKNAKSLVYDKHKEVLAKISGPLRKDRIIMGSMALILLFDPQDSLRHSNSVGLDNLVYLCILRKYLIGTQPDPLEKYERLVEATHVIHACNEEYNVFFSRNFQPEQITPLLIEIFDISMNNSV